MNETKKADVIATPATYEQIKLNLNRHGRFKGHRTQRLEG